MKENCSGSGKESTLTLGAGAICAKHSSVAHALLQLAGADQCAFAPVGECALILFLRTQGENQMLPFPLRRKEETEDSLLILEWNSKIFMGIALAQNLIDVVVDLGKTGHEVSVAIGRKYRRNRFGCDA